MKAHIILKIRSLNNQNSYRLYFSLTPDRKLEWWQVSLGSTSQSTNPDRSQLLFRDGWSTSSPRRARASTRCRFATEPFVEGRSRSMKDLPLPKGVVRLKMSQISIPKTKTKTNKGSCTYYVITFGGPERPPPCNIVIIWAYPPLCNTVIIWQYPSPM